MIRMVWTQQRQSRVSVHEERAAWGWRRVVCRLTSQTETSHQVSLLRLRYFQLVSWANNISCLESLHSIHKWTPQNKVGANSCKEIESFFSNMKLLKGQFTSLYTSVIKRQGGASIWLETSMMRLPGFPLVPVCCTSVLACQQRSSLGFLHGRLLANYNPFWIKCASLPFLYLFLLVLAHCESLHGWETWLTPDLSEKWHQFCREWNGFGSL